MNRLQLEQTIKEYGDSIYSFCIYLTKDKSEADDLYQDTFLKAIELDKIDFSINPKSYLLGIRVNLWKNKQRKKLIRNSRVNIFSMRQEEEKDYPDNSHTPDITAEKDEIKSRVRRAVGNLDGRYRAVVLLYYMEDMTVPQIAAILKIPQGTVKSRLYKARKLLEKQLEDFV